MTKIIQTNLGRSKRAMDLLRKKCADEEVEFALVAEPNKFMAQSGARWIPDGKVDVAIYIPHHQTKVTGSGYGDGFVWVNSKEMTIYACYITPTADAEGLKRYLDSIKTDILKQKKSTTSLLIGGDFNAKAHDWDSPVEDAKGNALAEWVTENNLVILNNGGAPTFERNASKSWIDVTMCTAALRSHVRQWRVNREEENLSHHNNIEMEIGGLAAERKQQVCRKGWHFKEEVAEELANRVAESTNNPNYKYTPEEFALAVQKACDCTLRKKREDHRKRAVHWWNTEIAGLRESCVKAKRERTRANRNATIPENQKSDLHELYRKRRTELKKAITKAKAKAWKALCDEVDQDKWGIGYKIVTGKIGVRKPLTLTDEERVDVTRAMFPVRPETEWPPIACQPEEIPRITVEEVIEAGKKTKSGKTPGPDGVPPEVIKAIAKHTPEILVKTMNKMLSQGTIPTKWKEGNLVLIEKATIAGQSHAYRPICLLNAAAKFYEQILSRRITEELEEKASLSEMQYGFRKGRSTVDAIQRVQQIVTENRKKPHKKYVVLVTLDVSNAFNSAPWKGIIEELQGRRISPYLVRACCGYLHNRSIHIAEGKTMKITCGVPQGSVLGPTLWNVYYDGALRQLMPYETSIVGYADDLALVVCGDSGANIERDVEEAIVTIMAWMRDKGLQLATHKTKAVILADRRILKSVSFRAGSAQITNQPSLKYLGVTFGHNMNMGHHIARVAQKADKTAAALCRIMPNIGGPSTGTRTVISSVVNSILLYAAPTWNKWVLKAKYRKILERTQRKTLIRVARAYRTTSTRALQAITGIAPIHLQALERTYRYEADGAAEMEASRKDNTMRKWEEEWSRGGGTASWTQTLLPTLTPWVTRKHGELNHYLTQFLSGHGCFGTYLFRFKIRNSESCDYCGERDSPEHTVMHCMRWQVYREEAEEKIGVALAVDNIVGLMLESGENYEIIDTAISKMMKTKANEERLFQRQG